MKKKLIPIKIKKNSKNHTLIFQLNQYQEEIENYYFKKKSLNKRVFDLLIFTIISFLILTLIILFSTTTKSFNLKEEILAFSKYGLESLELGKEKILNLDTESATYYFNLAYNNFKEAEKKISGKKIILASLSFIPSLSKYSKDAQNFIKLGESLSSLGIEITQVIKEILDFKKENFLNHIENIKKHEFLLKKEVKTIEKLLPEINLYLFDKDTIEKFNSSFTKLKEYLNTVEYMIDKTPEIGGFKEEKNYLLIFQNNNELRSTGGFIGSFGILKIEKGEIKEFFTEDVYKLDSFYNKAIEKGFSPYLPPPFPMNPETTGNWALRDSNLNPDFPETAKTIIDFYKKEIKFVDEKKYPEKIDGIITITPTVLEEILKITGPINMEEYNFTLNSSNLLETLQLEVEAGKDKKENRNPKTVLEILKEKIIEKLSSLEPQKIKELIISLIDRLDEKHILLYFENPELENIVKKLNWAGELKEIKEGEDFLMVINNNFGGGKSSLKINEEIEQEIEIKKDGVIEKKVKITREHTSDYYLKYFDPKTKIERWLIGENNNYTKIYVPYGSKIITADGIEKEINIRNENNKTTFGFNFSLLPKEKKTISLVYELPFKLNKEKFKKYSVIIQKQPGSLGSKIETILKLPENYQLRKTNGIEKKENKTIFFSNILSKDQFFYVIYSF